jgi:zinc transport system ATP-binding protein
MITPTSTEPLIEASGVTFRIGDRELISAVDLEVHAGEILSLIGPNGAGKTTLARLLLGIMRPSSGRIRRRPNLVVGYVPQRFAVDPILPLTVNRFLGLGRRITSATGSTALAEVGATHLADAPLHQLSGGEFQRVALARALARDPDLLVLDEPVQGVDIAGQTELYGLVERIRDRRGCGVLLISHDLHIVMGATDRVICLNRHVCCSGQPEAVSRDPAYVELFGHRAARRLAVYSHHHDHAHDLHGEVVRERQPNAPADGAADRDAR